MKSYFEKKKSTHRFVETGSTPSNTLIKQKADPQEEDRLEL